MFEKTFQGLGLQGLRLQEVVFSVYNWSMICLQQNHNAQGILNSVFSIENFQIHCWLMATLLQTEKLNVKFIVAL